LERRGAEKPKRILGKFQALYQKKEEEKESLLVCYYF
jgi:hypothetical protein